MRLSASVAALVFRLRLVALVALAGVVCAALVSLAPAGAQGPPDDLALALRLAGEGGEVEPGATIQVRAELRHGGGRVGGGIGVSRGELSVSGSYRWGNGRSSVAIPIQQVGVGGDGVDQASDALLARDAEGRVLTVEDEVRGRLQAAAWDGRTLAARVLPTGGVTPQILIYDTSTTPATYRATVRNPGLPERHGSADRFGSGHNDVISPDIAAVAVWQEDADTAWLFVGAEATRDGGTEEIGALHIYELRYAANGALTVGDPTTLQPPASEYSNRASGNAARYGSNVAVSADGSTLVVGARRMNHVGALYVYDRPSGGWDALTYARGVKVTPVAVPSWGTADARPFDATSAADCDAWCRSVTANATGPLPDNHAMEGTRFGVGKLGISADGSTIAVGALAKIYPDDTPAGRFSGGVQRGEVFIFTEPSGGWANAPAVSGTEIAAGENASAFDPSVNYSPGPTRRVTAPTATLRPSRWAGAAAENFGSAVDISADGAVVAVTSGTPRPTNTHEPVDNAAAYIFQRSGRAWTNTSAPTAKFTLDPADRFWGAWGMDLNNAGDTLLIGQRVWNGNRGRALVFTRSAGGWADIASGLGDRSVVPATPSGWQLTLPVSGASSAGEFGAPLYQLNGNGLAISATGHQYGYDRAGEIWIYESTDDRCATAIGEESTTTTCEVVIDDGRIRIPASAPGGSFTITAQLTANGRVLRDTLTVTVAGGAPAADLAASLSSPAADALSTWQGEQATTASALLAALGGDVRAILVLQGSRWVAYGRVNGGEIPGSVDAAVPPGARLWLAE